MFNFVAWLDFDRKPIVSFHCLSRQNEKSSFFLETNRLRMLALIFVNNRIDFSVSELAAYLEKQLPPSSTPEFVQRIDVILESKSIGCRGFENRARKLSTKV